MSYPIIELLSNTRITHNLPATAAAGTNFGPAYWVAGRNDQTKSFVLKAAVYNSTADVPFSVRFDGLKAGARAQLTVLTAPEGGFAHNTPQHKDAVKKTVSEVKADQEGVVAFSLPDLSVAVLEAKW